MIWIMLILFPPNVNSSHREALLYVFGDNEAVIKMSIKGRSPTMRHVSRTHRVAHDWLFDRINLDPKIQIKCVDTKKQLADILTKGCFSRDEWNHLLRLLKNHEFPNVFLQPFSLEQKAKHHVEESSGKKGRRRTCGSKTEVSMFGIKNLP